MVIQQLQRLLPLHGFGHGAAGRGVADQGTLQPSHRDLDAEAGPRGERKGLDFLQVEKYHGDKDVFDYGISRQKHMIHHDHHGSTFGVAQRLIFEPQKNTSQLKDIFIAGRKSWISHEHVIPYVGHLFQ